MASLFYPVPGFPKAEALLSRIEYVSYNVSKALIQICMLPVDTGTP